MKSVSISITLIVLISYDAVQHAASVEIADATKPLNPIVLISGYNGNRLIAKLDREEVPYDYCERKSDGWFELWLNESDYEPDLVNCFMDNMSLEYNSVERRTYNRLGVSIRAQFGETEPLEYYSSKRDLRGSAHFNVLVQRLVDLGYERNKNLLGAAYDFRKAPNELAGYFASLEELVEQTYLNNGEQPVVLICHSMGCPNTLFFLQSRREVWKSIFIRSLVALSGSWAGSVNRLMGFVSGGNYNIYTMPNLKRTDVITWPSSIYSFPSKQLFPGSQVFVRDIENQYTANDYKELFEILEYPVGYEIYLDVKDLIQLERPPGVEVHCFHGFGIDTIEQLVYNSTKLGKLFNDNPTKVYGPGDGFINLESLRTCLNWRGSQMEPVYYKNFSSISHNEILDDENVFAYIKEALQL